MIRFCFIFSILIPIITYSNDCIVRRGALEIGSSNTKIVIAEINKCSPQIKKILFERKIKIDYVGDYRRSNKKGLSSKILNEGFMAILDLIALGKVFKPSSLIAISSKFFKKLSNQKDFFSNLKKETGIRVFMISPKMEAILQFISVSTSYSGDLKNILLWDIGSSGMSFTRYDGKNYHVYLENISSEGFKNMVLEGIIGKSHLTTNSPNPLGNSNTTKAMDMIRVYSKFNTPQMFKTWGNTLETIGTGGVHYSGILNLLKKDSKSYRLGEIDKAIDKYKKLNDKEINSLYASTQVTNLILVRGYMKSVGINEVAVKKVNPSLGVLLHPKFWQ